MNTEVTILGTGTCNLAPDRNAASVLINREGSNLVYDFGRGTATRLVGNSLRQDDIEHIFLSHYHPDHVSDLIPYLHAASWSQIDKRSKDLHIYGQKGLGDFYKEFQKPFGEGELSRGFSIYLHEVEPGEQTVAGQKYLVSDLHHSYGLRFGKYAIAGDANISDELVAFLKDSPVSVFDAGHISDEEIITLAVETLSEIMYCSHQYRELDGNALNEKAAARGYRGNIIVANDNMKI